MLAIIWLSNLKWSEQNFCPFPWSHVPASLLVIVGELPVLLSKSIPSQMLRSPPFSSTPQYPRAVGHLSFCTGVCPGAHKCPLPSPSGRWDPWTHIPHQLPPHFTFSLYNKMTWKCYLYLLLPHPFSYSILNLVHSGLSPPHSAETALVKINYDHGHHMPAQWPTLSPHLTTCKQHLTQLMHALLLVLFFYLSTFHHTWHILYMYFHILHVCSYLHI